VRMQLVLVMRVSWSVHCVRVYSVIILIITILSYRHIVNIIININIYIKRKCKYNTYPQPFVAQGSEDVVHSCRLHCCAQHYGR
jgi:hypothetical protein